MLQLYKEYSISTTVVITRKLTQQYVGLFCIFEKIGQLAYKLDISTNWKIYPVFLVAQLKPAPNPAQDPFARPFPSHPPPVFVDRYTNVLKSFKIEQLFNKRLVKRGKDRNIEYLVRSKEYGP